MRSGSCINELAADADPTPCFSHAAFKDVSDAQLLPDLLHVYRATFVRKARIASDDEQLPETRQSRNDFFDHAIGKVLLLAVATQVLKWQDGNRWLLGQGQG